MKNLKVRKWKMGYMKKIMEIFFPEINEKINYIIIIQLKIMFKFKI